jgi:DNA-binding NarL/FixJ family response regulator
MTKLQVDAGGRAWRRRYEKPSEIPPTARQDQVLQFIAQGWTRAEIATELGITLTTVRYHLESLRIRLAAENTPHMIHLAWERGWLTTTSPGEANNPSRDSRLVSDSE